ncbi:MAG: urease accessory protein UreD [Lachnospiraceae bacterium]
MNHNGKINLLLKSQNQKTYIANNFYQLPLQVMLPEYEEPDSTKIIYLLNPTGGVLQEDVLNLSIELEADAKACISNASATKLYRCEAGMEAVQTTDIVLGEHAVLEYFPDLIIPYAGSAYTQTTRLHLAKSSTLLLCDCFCGGRTARDERFDFRKFASELTLHVDGRLKLAERIELTGDRQRMKHRTAMQEYTYTATLYVYSARATRAQDALAAQPEEKDALVRTGFTLVEEHLLVVKVLAAESWCLKEEVEHIWGIVRAAVLDKPPLLLRK